jgi:hypothetical protein
MTSEVKQLYTRLLADLRPEFHTQGFSNYKNRWVLVMEEATAIVEIEPSDWGGHVQLTLGFCLHRLPNEDSGVSAPEPSRRHAYQCPINLWTLHLDPGHRDRVLDALQSSSDAMQYEERLDTLLTHLRNVIVPLALDCGTEVGLARRLHAGEFKNGLVHKAVRTHLAAK